MVRPRNYYQISKVDQQRKQEQMVAEVEGRREAENLVEKHLQYEAILRKKKSPPRVKTSNERRLIPLPTLLRYGIRFVSW